MGRFPGYWGNPGEAQAARANQWTMGLETFNTQHSMCSVEKIKPVALAIAVPPQPPCGHLLPHWGEKAG
jgi:hypothetical protein